MNVNVKLKTNFHISILFDKLGLHDQSFFELYFFKKIKTKKTWNTFFFVLKNKDTQRTRMIVF